MTCHVQNLMVWYTFLGPSWQVIQAYYMSTNSLKYHQCMSAVYIYLLAHLFYFTLQRLGRPKLAVYFFRKKMLDPEMPTWSFNCYNTRDGCPFLMDMQCFALIFKSPEII